MRAKMTQPKPAAARNGASPAGSTSGSAAAALSARVVHEIDGRLRARLSKPMAAAAMAALAERIGALPGVRRVRARPNTGSVIIEHANPKGETARLLVERGVFRLAAPTHAPPIDQAAQLGMLRLDLELARQTDGAVNFRSALALLLLAGAAIQAARGQVAGPATTLALSALSLLEKPKG